MENMTNIPQEIQDKAARLCAIKGNTKTLEQRIVELMADATKKAKKTEKSWKKREIQNAIVVMPMHSDDFIAKRLIEQRKAAGLI